MTEEQQTAIGQKLIDVLGLKLNRGGRVNTSWGDKTPLGFYLTVKRIMEEAAPEEGDDNPFHPESPEGREWERDHDTEE